MKKFLLVSFMVFVCNFSYGDDVKEKVSEYVSGIVTNVIPGEGETEFSIDLRENNKPDYKILITRELAEDENGNLFSQFSLVNTEKLNDERIVANLGLGKRYLSDNNKFLTGLNAFLDGDEDGNLRYSLGAEAQNAVLGFNVNYYIGLQDANGEKVLDGYDLQINSQIPYLHWATAFVNTYGWDGIDRDDIEGTKIGTDMQVTSMLSIEATYDDKDKKGLEDEYFVNLMFTFPPKDGPSLVNDPVNKSAWKEERDMRGELLTKVKRNNKIVVEFKGTSTISRTD